MIRLKPPPLTASLFVFFGLCILIGLGYWQWDKYLLRMGQRDACLKVPQVSFDKNFHTAGDRIPSGCGGLFSGQVLEAPLIPVGMRMHEGVAGFDIHALMLAQDGSSVLVNLGWSETELPAVDPRQIHTVGGPLIALQGRNAFSPSNTPEEGRWFVVDTDEIRTHFKLGNRFSSHVLYAENLYDTQNKDIMGFESPTVPKSYLNPMTHFQYALFWFSMAGALLVIFVLRFCRKT